MALNIKNEETQRLARELAQRKGNLIWLNAPCLVQIYPILNKFRKNIACK